MDKEEVVSVECVQPLKNVNLAIMTTWMDLDGIMIRTFEQSEVENLAKYGSIPIINGLTDFCHPCQVLADLLTVREHKGHLDGLKMCYIGDNISKDLIAPEKLGMRAIYFINKEENSNDSLTISITDGSKSGSYIEYYSNTEYEFIRNYADFYKNKVLYR